jgi:ribosomal protein S18 acetylase RimI-like enzyme
MRTEVSTYHSRLEPAAARTLGRAFADDPVFRWMVGGDVARTTWCLRQGIRQCAPHRASSVIGEDARAVACWLPPSAPFEVPFSRQLVIGNWAAPFRCGLGATRRIVAREADGQARYRRHLREPTWVLDLLGVDPEHQGRGLGRALVEKGLERVDRERRPAYLITYKRSNVSFYESFGFEVQDFAGSPDIPTGWSMLRASRPAPRMASDR